jgi:hypothetical protein
MQRSLELPVGSQFVVGVPIEGSTDTFELGELGFRFVDRAGTDVTNRFSSEQ